MYRSSHILVRLFGTFRDQSGNHAGGIFGLLCWGWSRRFQDGWSTLPKKDAQGRIRDKLIHCHGRAINIRVEQDIARHEQSQIKQETKQSHLVVGANRFHRTIQEQYLQHTKSEGEGWNAFRSESKVMELRERIGLWGVSLFSSPSGILDPGKPLSPLLTTSNEDNTLSDFHYFGCSE